MLNERGITLSQALDLEPLRNSNVLSGKNGLKNIITGVNIMEVPDIANWVKSGEFLLTTAYSLKDDKKALTNLITELHKKGLAGIGIKTKRYIESIPVEVLDISDKLGFPIIELPYDIAFSDITSVLLREIFDKQTVILLKLEDIHKKLMDVVLRGGGLKDICGMLSGIIENPLILRDYVFGKNLTLTYGNAEAGLDASIKGILKMHNEFEEIKPGSSEPYVIINERLKAEAYTDSYDRYVFPIIAGNKVFGEIHVMGIGRKVNAVDIRAVQYTCAIIALEIMKQMTIFEVESRHKNEYMEELMSSDSETNTAARERAELFGLEENMKYVVSVLFIDEMNKRFSDISKNSGTWYKSKLIQAIEDEASRGSGKVLVGSRGDNITILMGYPNNIDDTEVKKRSIEAAAKIYNFVEKSFGAILCHIGISRSSMGLLTLYKGNEEAKKSMSFSRIFQNRNVIHYDDLGVFRLLCMEHQEQEIRKFCQETVMPLIEYDRNKDGELVKTLRTYFECGGNLKQVCKKMYIHYNTILYRMQKIQQLSGLDLADSNSRLNMEISLKIMSMINNVIE